MDYINESNLRTYRLALVDDDELCSTLVASNPMVAMPLVPIDRIVATPTPTPTEIALASQGNSPRTWSLHLCFLTLLLFNLLCLTITFPFCHFAVDLNVTAILQRASSCRR